MKTLLAILATAIQLAAAAHLRAQTGSAFYVAPGGSDSNNGSVTKPFLTIAHARDVMRRSSVKTTFICAGKYYLTDPISLTSQDNGESFLACPGEAPVISGGQRVTGFVSEGNGIYSAALSSPSELDLTVGGIRRHPAQSGPWTPTDPNISGWLIATGGSSDSFSFKAGDLPASPYSPNEWADTYHSGDQGRGWTNSINLVTSVDTTNHIVHLSGSVPWALDNGALYRLLNNPIFIRYDGDFAWRASDSHLVYKTSDTLFESKGVVVARLDHLFDVTSAKRITLRGLTLTDTTRVPINAGRDNNFQFIGKGAIALVDSQEAVVDRNTFTNVGEAVSLNGSSNNEVTRNLITDTGYSGIEMRNSNSNVISNNSIARTGEFMTNSCGICGINVSHNTIAHNLIQHVPISAVGIFDPGTSSNIGNVIEYNKVLYATEQVGDYGAIYMLGRSGVNTDTTIRYNYISNTGYPGTFPWGWLPLARSIYLDDNTSGVLVYGNFSTRSTSAAYLVHGGSNITIQNDWGVLSREPFVWLQDEPEDNIPRARNIQINHNIIYANDPQPAYWWTDDWTGHATIDHNDLYNVPRYPGQDVDSLLADPQFTDPRAGDYSLKSTSPARQLGINDLPWAQMGLTDRNVGALGYSDHSSNNR